MTLVANADDRGAVERGVELPVAVAVDAVPAVHLSVSTNFRQYSFEGSRRNPSFAHSRAAV
jgi:hypothetical protein